MNTIRIRKEVTVNMVGQVVYHAIFWDCIKSTKANLENDNKFKVPRFQNKKREFHFRFYCT